MKYSNYIVILLLVIILTGCGFDQKPLQLSNADYNPESHTLIVDFENNPDTTLQQIIELSDIRRSGYGVLLNVHNASSNEKIETIRYRFYKLDINAVHHFNISSIDTLASNISIAIEGANFVWVMAELETIVEQRDLRSKLVTSHVKSNPLLILNN